MIRWINVTEGNSIAWNVQAQKKSVNLGIFKHPGSAGRLPVGVTSSASGTFEASNAHTADHDAAKTKRNDHKAEPTTLVEKLDTLGISCVEWEGKCDADKISIGTYNVPSGETGIYGIVLDNTFSRTVAKTVMLAFVIHPTDSPPKVGGFRNQQRRASAQIIRPSPSMRTPSDPASDPSSLPQIFVPEAPGEPDFFAGVTYKKRRKRNQGYAKRFFVLDFTSATLSYYQNSRSSALRGAVPLSLASIGVDGRAREFHIDSGAEVWHVKLRQQKDFVAWRQAISKVAASPLVVAVPRVTNAVQSATSPTSADFSHQREWQRVEQLVGRVSGTRQAVRRLAQDTDPNSVNALHSVSPTVSISDLQLSHPEDQGLERPSFWKRKPSSGSQAGGAANFFRRTVSGQSTPQLHISKNSATSRATSPRIKAKFSSSPDHNDEIHQRCLALLRDLDETVTDFSNLLLEHKLRHGRQAPVLEMARASIDSTRSEIFFDAEDGLLDSAQMIHQVHSEAADAEKDFASDADSDASSDVVFQPLTPTNANQPDHGVSLFPRNPAITILPDITPVEHRATVLPPRLPPPSIIGFLRKNAGKDLSTVAMPVSANEPTSLLQRLAEPFESARLLAVASSAPFAGPDKVIDRLLYITAFAIAGFASNRVKERAIRKPFNPMLGESFELIRGDRSSDGQPGFRFVAEKVCHHPVEMAWQADALDNSWSISQSQRPTQKFWGKSMELNTEGKYRLTLHNVSGDEDSTHGEQYVWRAAPAYLRNVIAGEKYLEPVQTMTITNNSTGHRAVATFKTSGMFSGRSEDVTVACFGPGSQAPLPVQLVGKWTTSLSRSDTGEIIWTVGPLVQNAAKVYGFTSFTAGLNEITSIEKDAMSPTDSRLRPDQRALEDGDLDTAEALKAKLEERQRSRRKTLETHGRSYEPTFFHPAKAHQDADEEQIWLLTQGQHGYWERRARHDWNNLVDIFET